MTKKQDPDPFVRGIDPRMRIRIHSKMSWTQNTGVYHTYYIYFFGGLECVGHSLAYVAILQFFFRDVWIRTQRAAVASMHATHLATHPLAKPPIPLLSQPSPTQPPIPLQYLATYPIHTTTVVYHFFNADPLPAFQILLLWIRIQFRIQIQGLMIKNCKTLKQPFSVIKNFNFSVPKPP